MIDFKMRLELLEDWENRVRTETFRTYNELKEYYDLSKKERTKFHVRGCYLIYKKKDDREPIYIGSNTTNKGTVGYRLYNALIAGRNHPLPSRIIGYEKLSRKLFEHISDSEKAENLVWYRRYCSEFSFRVLKAKTEEEIKQPLLMEIGLIFLFKPKYNHESKEFEDLKVFSD